MGTHLTDSINMVTLKTITAKSYLISFQYIVCRTAVAITAMYIVPQDIMYLWRMTHVMSNTRELLEISLQRLGTHIVLQYVPHVLGPI